MPFHHLAVATRNTRANHVAFDPGSMEELTVCKKRWLEHGYDVLEIDHAWCHSTTPWTRAAPWWSGA